MSDIQKPRYASPCNHCGLCCRLTLCHVGKLAFPGHVAPCPALVEGVDGSLCGLVMIERATAAEPMIQRQLGIGCGCSMEDDGTTDAEIEAFDRNSHDMMFGTDSAFKAREIN